MAAPALESGVSLGAEEDDGLGELLAPTEEEPPEEPPPPRRPPNKAELRRIKRQVASRRKQGEAIDTDEELERQGFRVDGPVAVHPPPAAAELGASAAAAQGRHGSPERAVSAPPPSRRERPSKQMRRNNSNKNLKGMPRNGSSSKNLNGMTRNGSSSNGLNTLAYARRAAAAAAAAAAAPAAAPPAGGADGEGEESDTDEEGASNSAAGADDDGTGRALCPIPRAELRKIKQAVLARRKAGEDVWTDDELERLGYCVDSMYLYDNLHPPREAHPSSGMALLVPKARQRDTWDCGLACVVMALRALGAPDEACSLQYLRTRLPRPSVWTIDLAYLLAEFGVAAQYLTRTDPSRPEEVTRGKGADAFYSECLAEDAARVELMFKRAAGEGVRVRKARLSLDEVTNLLQDETHLVIALVNNHESAGLYASVDDADADAAASEAEAEAEAGPQAEAQAEVPPGGHGHAARNSHGHGNGARNGHGHGSGARNGHGPGNGARGGHGNGARNGHGHGHGARGGFSGHYVLLVGVEAQGAAPGSRAGAPGAPPAGAAFLVKDPARREDCLLVGAADLERARRAEGTDEDLLLVPLGGPPPSPPEEGTPPKAVKIAYAARRAERRSRESRDSARGSERGGARRSRSHSPLR